MAQAPLHVRVQREDFDLSTEIAHLIAGRTDIGAVANFVGLCRDESGQLAALELEHYPGMAEEEIARIANDAWVRWQLKGLTVIHRFGRIVPGEQIVLVLAISSHRRDALAAVDFLMDYLKTKAPFWKKEHRLDGAGGDWVAAKDEDDSAASRW